MESLFSSTKQIPPYEQFQLKKGYMDEEDENKVDLGIGAYRTEEGKPWVLPVVRRIEKEMSHDKSLNHEYLMSLGCDSFRNIATQLLLGENSEAILQGRAFGVQSLSGTGALRIGGEFLVRVLKIQTLYISTPTWNNQEPVFSMSGFMDMREYRYWDTVNCGLDLDGMIEDLRQAPVQSVIVLHVCAHNPTGCDPTREQWIKIADVMQEHNLFPFFDCAYHGLASGDLEEDLWPVRYFVERGFELFCAQSFAKNMGLYNERIGNLTVVVKDATAIPAMETQIMFLVRAMYCTPNNHGMQIVNRVLHNLQYFQEWKDCLRIMAGRILEMRKALRERLECLETPGTWEHITKQIGMFSFTGLTGHQIDFLVQERHIYLLRNGRINMCGLNMKNVDYVAQAIHDAIEQFPATEKTKPSLSSCNGF